MYDRLLFLLVPIFFLPAFVLTAFVLTAFVLPAFIVSSAFADAGHSHAHSGPGHYSGDHAGKLAENTVDTARFTLYFPSPGKSTQPVSNLHNIADSSLAVLEKTYEEISSALNVRPETKVVLRFLPPAEFHRRTGAPPWTSAMYLRGEITIPLSASSGTNVAELTRAIRHEYVHAVTAELSSRRCPAWLDEGLAQLFEGEPNPLLGPALRVWVTQNEALPLSWLQNGFMTLSEDLVPVAYAQSLFATRKLVERYGYGSITTFLKELGEGKDQVEAFEVAFKTDAATFEDSLTVDMRRWVGTGNKNP